MNIPMRKPYLISRIADRPVPPHSNNCR